MQSYPKRKSYKLIIQCTILCILIIFYYAEAISDNLTTISEINENNLQKNLNQSAPLKCYSCMSINCRNATFSQCLELRTALIENFLNNQSVPICPEPRDELGWTKLALKQILNCRDRDAAERNSTDCLQCGEIRVKIETIQQQLSEPEELEFESKKIFVISSSSEKSAEELKNVQFAYARLLNCISKNAYNEFQNSLEIKSGVGEKDDENEVKCLQKTIERAFFENSTFLSIFGEQCSEHDTCDFEYCNRDYGFSSITDGSSIRYGDSTYQVIAVFGVIAVLIFVVIFTMLLTFINLCHKGELTTR